ncbi:MAG: hypothetical protein HUJ98_14705, partial [Bacteroidaceae bacterium]|nr:hypothetical protein [Bacteroidaceae bacterium]
SISSTYYGPQFASQVDDELSVPLHYYMKFNECENAKDIVYKSFEFLYNHGEGGCMKYENGKWLDLESIASPAVLDKDFGENWWDWELCLYCQFDFEKYPEKLRALQTLVKKHVPAEWIERCEFEWSAEGPEFLVNSIDWNPRRLRDVQDFLDEVNQIVLPIKEECDCYCMGDWHIVNGPKATATWDWFEDGFKVVATEL